jgi:dihydrodipicolinate reductase
MASPIAGELRALADAHAQVVVDFTVADASRTTLPWLAMHGIHAVVGTTGFTDDDFASFRHRVQRQQLPDRQPTSPSAPC